MTERIRKVGFAFLISFPIVFVVVFFGYLRLNFDIVLHTDNIKGEGICQSYVCPTASYAAFYKIEFYFGSELKKATLQGFHSDVNSLELVTSDVSKFDITSVDSYIRGIHLIHLDPADILPEGEEVEGSKALLKSEKGVLHVEVFDPDNGATVTINHAFIPLWFWIIYFTAIVFFSLLLSLLLVWLFDRIPALKLPLLSVSCILVVLLAGCFFCGSLPYVSYKRFLLNWLFLFAPAMLLNALTLPFLGTIFVMAFTTVWYIANYFVIALRNKPIMPADLKAIGTATEVMGGYTFTPSLKMVLGVAVVAFYAVVLVFVWKKNRSGKKASLKGQLIKRGITAGIAILLMVIGVNTNTFKSLNSFAWDVVLLKSFHEEGMVLTFLKSVFNSQVKEPEGYSRDLVEDYLDEYEDGKAETEADSDTQEKITEPGKEDDVHPTNIIMVMNEAFSDLRTVGLDESIDVMPFIDSLDENTTEGSLYVSVFGGGTCNTEFEALTGNTLAFLGTGAYPYTENITDPMWSLAEYFKSLGYSTDAFHANEPQNWNRNMVYPNLGFDEFHSIEDYKEFEDVTYLHEMPADISDYKYIEAVDEEKKDSPRFLFNVTMQNHSGYERWLDVEKPETVEENGSDLYVDTQIYLSLIKASDDEVKQLVETYKDSKEPTMIIFFGDHQPGLPAFAINEVYTDIVYNLDLYKSKFFIWTNYETETQHDVHISANYLPWLILERGNFDLPPYVQMLKELHERYPIISSQGVMDDEGNVYTGVAELADDPLIRKYQYVQYANLFDEIDPAWFEVG